MIKIEVQPYCDACLDFTPDVEYPQVFHADLEEYIFTDTVVRCRFRKRCSGICRYLKRELNKGGSNIDSVGTGDSEETRD